MIIEKMITPAWGKYERSKTMTRRWYGSFQNRLEENRMFCDKIEIGTGMTEYSYSDRHAYEVVEVKDQKHITVRRLDHKHIGDGSMDNNWELISNPENPTYEMTKRGDKWYWTVTVTADILTEPVEIETWLFLCHNNIEADKLREKEKITRYHRANVSFGRADYYYDYEF
jgi:hypothetical protein